MGLGESISVMNCRSDSGEAETEPSRGGLAGATPGHSKVRTRNKDAVEMKLRKAHRTEMNLLFARPDVLSAARRKGNWLQNSLMTGAG